MKKVNLTLVVCLLLSISHAALSQQWAIKGEVVDACTCKGACPYIFGSEPTQGFCYTNKLIQIKEGHYNNVILDGLDVVVAFKVKGWGRIYVSENANEEQVHALASLIPVVFHYEQLGIKLKPPKKTRISISRTPLKVKFTTPYSAVTMVRVDGPNGKPIRIKNSFFPDYIQYKSTENSYHGEEDQFHYSGTSGFISSINIKSED